MKFLGIAVFLAGVVSLPAQQIVGFNLTRGGSYNLEAQTNVQTAISSVLPSATYAFTGALDSGALTGAVGVVIMSAHDNINPIIPLSSSEQAALTTFVANGGFAVVVTDSDYIPTLFDVTNDSFLAGFGFGADGAYSSPITITNPSANPISNGPFGLVTSLSGIAAGSYSSVPTAFQALGNNADGYVAAGYFARGALNTGSGAVLFVADSNVYNYSVGGSAAANYTFLSNFVSYAAIPEPETISLMTVGSVMIGGLALRKRLRRPKAKLS